MRQQRRLLGRPTNCFPGNSRPTMRCRLPSPIEAISSDPNYRDSRLARLEAILFLSNEPLPLRRLTTAASLKDATETRQLLQRLQEMYDADATAFQVVEIAGGHQLLTRPTYRPWLMRANRSGPDWKLSGAALETLAVVAYRQPITRADVEGIRGVGCGELLTQLMEKGFVKIVGRHESLGRPVLYGTTKKFLQSFGLKSLKELPQADDVRSRMK